MAKYIEREPIMQGEKNITDRHKLESYVLNKSNNGHAYIITFIFNLAIILGFLKPSDIHYDYIGRAMDESIYYKGKKIPFTKTNKIKYQNSGFSCDR